MAQPTLGTYTATKDRLLTDQSICEQNRQLFRRFFEFEEYKLKRRSQLSALDAGCLKTLLAYVQKLRNVNKWFENKPLAEISEADIRRVYDGLEDGTIVTQRGTRFKDRNAYYSKVFKSKLFALAGKRELAQQVIEFTSPPDAVVRFVLEDDVRKIGNYVYEPEHRLLLWLAFDIGENIESLLALTAADCTRQLNPGTGDPEYRIQLRREILKRSRTPRSEITLYRETVQFLDDHLSRVGAASRLFSTGHRNCWKFLKRAARQARVVCQPAGHQVTWKDLRSGMACDLLRKGWSRDEINARLGHRPSSKEIDKYVNFFALDRHQPKARSQQFTIQKLEEQLQRKDDREKLAFQRVASMQAEMDVLKANMHDIIQLLSRTPVLADVEQAIAIKRRR